MSNIVISVENLSKSYKLGQIGTGTFSRDLEMWWARKRGKPNPFLKIGEADHGNVQGDTLWALKDINFTVQQGEVLGIIGRNGAGKSTLLKILSRVTAPTSGQVKVKGRIASLLEVGTGFHPELTGRENIYLNGAILGMNHQEVARKFDEIVAFAGIEKFIDSPVKRYSSGMYVRLAFAVAAHLESEILLVDEVLAVGDAEFQKKCLGKMGDVARQGRTVLFVSHNMGSIEELTSLSILLDTGRIVDHSITKEIIDKYLNVVKDERNSIFTDENENLKINCLNFDKTLTKQGFNENIYINFNVTFKTRIDNPEIAFGFTNKRDQRILTTRVVLEESLIGNHQIKCIVEKPQLPPANYSIDFYVGLTNGIGLYKKSALNFDTSQDRNYSSYLVKKRDGIGIYSPLKIVIEKSGKKRL
jgi:lipopolysaccharide transport system ATP-binding protein